MNRLTKKTRTQDVNGTQDSIPPPTPLAVIPTLSIPAPIAPSVLTENDSTHCHLVQNITQDRDTEDKSLTRPVDLPHEAKDKPPRVPRPPEVPQGPTGHMRHIEDKSPGLVNPKSAAVGYKFTSTDIRYRTVSQVLMAGARTARDAKVASKTKDSKVKGARGPPLKPRTTPTLGKSHKTRAGPSKTATVSFRSGDATPPPYWTIYAREGFNEKEIQWNGRWAPNFHSTEGWDPRDIVSHQICSINACNSD